MHSNSQTLSNPLKTIFKEVKRTLETQKLSLWSYKADLETVNQRLKKIKESIDGLEDSYAERVKERIVAEQELEFDAEVIDVDGICRAGKLEYFGRIVKDICEGIGCLMGLKGGSASVVRKALKDPGGFKEVLKKFNACEAEKSRIDHVGMIIQKHSLGLRVKYNKVPEEISALIKWLLNAQIVAKSLNASEQITQELTLVNRKHNKLYIEILEINEIIREINNKISQLLEAAEICESYSRPDMINESSELAMMRTSLCQCEELLKKCRGRKFIEADDSPASSIVDSLFITNSHSSAPKIIEMKEYSDESSIELPTQRNLQISNNTLESLVNEQGRGQRKKKKKCCGLISR